ncbi:MAG: Outer membrane protein assembly factor BamB [bacterium]|nr:Outer membrane protein assembly factor BamB [bacterium]
MRPLHLRVAQLSVPTAACLLLTLLAVFPPVARGADPSAGLDWPQYGGVMRNFTSEETGWNRDWAAREPAVVWSHEIGIGFSSMAVAGGRVYAMGYADDKDTVFCFDATTGDEIWKHSYPAPLLDKYYEGGPGGSPTVDGDRVYTLSKTGDFFCFDAATGKIHWQKNIKTEHGAKQPEWAFACSPLIEGDWVILEVGKTLAFDRKSGKLIWESSDYGAAYSTPVAFDLNGRRCLAVFPEHGLVILDAKNGKEISKQRWETNYGVNAASPVVQGNKVFVSSGYNRGCGLFELTPTGEAKPVWENKNMRNHFSTTLLWKGHLYGFDESDLKCLDLATGEEKWFQDGLGKGSLMIADGNLVILSEKGELVLAEPSPEGYKELGRTQILSGKCWTVPVLSHGRLFARNAKGDLVCVDLSGAS